MQNSIKTDFLSQTNSQNNSQNISEESRFSRNKLIYGNAGLEKLASSSVIVFGAGGVGGYVIEALARSGIGRLDIVDNDIINISNINRQILALEHTVGRPKTEVAIERIKSINPNIKTRGYQLFYLPETASEIDLSQYDYIVDAIDTVTAKIHLIVEAQKLDIKIISSMGTGNKTNPTMLEVADIYKTSVCPLARVMRQELKKRGIKKLKVVYSKEIPCEKADNSLEKSKVVGSTAFVPPAAGLIIASEVVKEILNSELRIKNLDFS